MPNRDGRHRRTGNPIGRPRADGLPAGQAPDSTLSSRLVGATIERTLRQQALTYPAAPIVLEPRPEDLVKAAALAESEEELAHLYALWALGVGIFSPSSTAAMQVRVKAADSLASIKGWFKRPENLTQVNLQANGDGGVSLVVMQNARGPGGDQVVDALPSEASVINSAIDSPDSEDPKDPST